MQLTFMKIVQEKGIYGSDGKCKRMNSLNLLARKSITSSNKEKRTIIIGIIK